jgi:hypothetical protein
VHFLVANSLDTKPYTVKYDSKQTYVETSRNIDLLRLPTAVGQPPVCLIDHPPFWATLHTAAGREAGHGQLDPGLPHFNIFLIILQCCNELVSQAIAPANE